MGFVDLIIKFVKSLQRTLISIFDNIVAMFYIILSVIIKTHYLALVRKTEFTSEGSRFGPLLVWCGLCITYIIVSLIVDPQDKPFCGLMYFK